MLQRNSSTSPWAFYSINESQTPKGHDLPKLRKRGLSCSSKSGNRNDDPPQSSHAPSPLLKRHQSALIPAVFFLSICLLLSWSPSIKGENEKVTKRGNLPPPVVQSPVDVVQSRDKTLEIKWLKVESASGYHIQVAEDKEFTVLQDDRKDIRGEAYILYNFSHKSYYFRVSSIDEDGYEGEWSDTVQLIINPSSS